jgi:hypothetical protein
MQIHTLLRILHDKRVKLTRVQKQLHYYAASEGLDATEAKALQRHKTSLLAWLDLTQQQCHETRVFSLEANLVSRLNGLALCYHSRLETLLLTAFVILLARYKQGMNATVASDIGAAQLRCLSFSWEAADSFVEVLKQVQNDCDDPVYQEESDIETADGIFYFSATPSSTSSSLPPEYQSCLCLQNNTAEMQGRWHSKIFNLPMPKHWQQLLQGIAQNPQQNAMRIPLFDLAERRFLLVEKNTFRPRNEAIENELIKPAFRRGADAEPQTKALAVISATQQLSYADLRHHADQFANYLRHQDIGAEDAVAVDLHDNAPAAMLALLQLGAACMFGEQGQVKPKLRIDKDLSMSALQFPKSEDEMCSIDLSAESQSACILDTEDADIRFSQRALAQFYATQPWTKPARTLAVADGQLYWQLCLNTLTFGGTWIHAPCDDAASLAAALRHYQVERAFVPTTLLLELADLNHPFPQLQELIHLGAALPVTDCLRAWLRGGDIQLYNLYHLPDSLALCVYQAPRDSTTWPDWLPIGEVLGGNAAYILDHNQQHVPIGMAGELYLSGPGIGLSAPTVARVQLTLHRQQLVMMPEEQNPLLTETCQVMQACRSYQQARYREDGVLDILPPSLGAD